MKEEENEELFLSVSERAEENLLELDDLWGPSQTKPFGDARVCVDVYFNLILL